MDEYYELYDYFGNIDMAVMVLQEWNDSHKNKKAKINFNDHWLYSDTVTLDSAYLEITGKTREEFITEKQKRIDKLHREKAEHEAKIPELTKEWIAKGHEVLDKKYWIRWYKCVPARLSDLYEGMELGACLEIVKALNEGCKLSYAKQLIDNQGHSGMSYSLVKAMVKAFCDRGNDFAEYLEKGRN